MYGYKSTRPLSGHILRKINLFRLYYFAGTDIGIDCFSCQTDIFIRRRDLFLDLFFFLFQVDLQKSSFRIFFITVRIESADPVSDTGNIFMGKFLDSDFLSVPGTRHDDKRAVTTLGRLIAEGFVESE